MIFKPTEAEMQAQQVFEKIICKFYNNGDIIGDFKFDFSFYQNYLYSKLSKKSFKDPFHQKLSSFLTWCLYKGGTSLVEIFIVALLREKLFIL